MFVFVVGRVLYIHIYSETNSLYVISLLLHVKLRTLPVRWKLESKKLKTAKGIRGSWQ